MFLADASTDISSLIILLIEGFRVITHRLRPRRRTHIRGDSITDNETNTRAKTATRTSAGCPST